MLLPVLSLVVGLAILAWSADRFVDGASGTARHFHVPPLLIGLLIIGFGTSAPEMVVSAMSALQGNPGIALGNAYGSNIANIALILGFTALLRPIAVQSRILKTELPLLLIVTLLAAFQLLDGYLGRLDAIILLAVFLALVLWSLREGLRRSDRIGEQVQDKIERKEPSLRKSVLWLIAGLLLLVASSRLLVWGATGIATRVGMSDLVIGLTVVAVGTSLPEMASTIAAARRNEHELALGNVIGSNLFNTLAVVGIAGSISPHAIDPSVLTRDVFVMGMLTASLFVIGYGFRGRPGRISRVEGAVLLAVWVFYTFMLLRNAAA
ncbi:calcium/sodium antiporter [bacterium]|nr:calcium/sodium antiporter [bacterium]